MIVILEEFENPHTGRSFRMPADLESQTVSVELAGAIVSERPMTEAELSRDWSPCVAERTIRDALPEVLGDLSLAISSADEFLALSSPTNAQIAQQVRRLTLASALYARVLRRLIRLAVRRLDASD